MLQSEDKSSVWNDAKTNPPDHTDVVICVGDYCNISKKFYSVASGWYHQSGVWILNKSDLDVDGDAWITLGFIPTHWMEVPPL